MPIPTCCIIDDDRLAVNELVALTHNNLLCRPVITATSVALAMDLLAGQPVDILFIRIVFWDDWLAQKHRLFRAQEHIVFLSGRAERCAKHLLRQIDHHLQPPYKLQDLEAFFRLLLNPYFKARPVDFFFLRVKHRYHVINFSDLRTVESKKGYLTIRTRTEEYTIVGTLARFQKRLPVRLSRAGRSLLIANLF